MIRSREIYIDPDTHQLLKWMVAAANGKAELEDHPFHSPDPKLTVDGLAGDILMQWIKTTQPKLVALLERRQALDKEAMELLK